MSAEVPKIDMKPSPPGELVREEILEELGLTVARAAEILGARRATLSDLVNGPRRPVARDGAAHREGLWRGHGHAAADAGLARRPHHTRACRRHPCREVRVEADRTGVTARVRKRPMRQDQTTATLFTRRGRAAGHEPRPLTTAPA